MKYYEALIDMGASNSYVSQKVWQKLQKENLAHLARANISARLADGTTVKILGLINIKILFNKKQISVQFHVLPRLDTDFVFGIDIIHNSQYEFKLNEQLGAIKNENIKKMSPEAGLEAIMKELRPFENINEPTTFGEHRIKLKNTEPIHFTYKPKNPALQNLINNEVDKMLAQNVIEQSTSPWSSPVV